MRLDKLISNNSISSRKEVNKLIRKKIVTVNNSIIIDPSFDVDINKDVVKIDGVVVDVVQNVYIALNKPSGYVCSNSENDGDSVFNLIEKNYIKDLHIVGRLDKDTTGLVIITNDGNFTHQIKSSKYQIEKEYEVELKNDLTNDMKKKLNKDIYLDGKKLKLFKLTNINKNKLNITLVEGKYHQIKRIFELVNNSVVKLKRIRIGNLKLQDLEIDESKYVFINKENIF